MFTHYRTQGLILGKTDIGESDRLFTIYTKDFGKLNLLAKAERKIKSKLRAGLELFYLTEIEFIQGKAYKTLTDTILINSFQNLRKDLKKTSIAFKISELLNELVGGEESDKKIWELLTKTFEELDKVDLKTEKSDLKIIYYYYFWNFISILGYQPELYNCALCQKKLEPKNIYFNSGEGELVCVNCKKETKEEKKVEADTVKIIRVLLREDHKLSKRLKIEDKLLRELEFVSGNYLSKTLEQIK